MEFLPALKIQKEIGFLGKPTTKGKKETVSLCLSLSLFFFFGLTHSIRKFLSQGLNPCQAVIQAAAATMPDPLPTALPEDSKDRALICSSN